MKTKENIFERLQNRLPPDRAELATAALTKAAVRQEISNRAIGEAFELVRHYRLQARCAIRDYRRWQAEQAVSETLRVLREHEGVLLRQEARAKTSLYLDAVRDYRDLIQLSLGQPNDKDNEE